MWCTCTSRGVVGCTGLVRASSKEAWVICKSPSISLTHWVFSPSQQTACSKLKSGLLSIKHTPFIMQPSKQVLFTFCVKRVPFMCSLLKSSAQLQSKSSQFGYIALAGNCIRCTGTAIYQLVGICFKYNLFMSTKTYFSNDFKV